MQQKSCFFNLGLFLMLAMGAACAPGAGPAAAPAPSAPPTTAPAAATGALAKIQVALGFVPSVQNAPYYVAQDKGYYAAEGLEVEFKYGQVQNLLKQLSDGTIEFASVSGDSLMPQRLQGVDITYIMTLWTKNPIGAAGIAGNNTPPLKSPADLKGKNIGISAPNSSTHFGLKALLLAANLAESDVKITAIGTTEVEALIAKRIDAAMTFLPNESAQMKSLGYQVDIIAVGDYLKLVPPGIATGDKTIKERPDLVQRFVNATLRGLKDALADPASALASGMKRMPELSPENQPLQRDVLAATLDYYRPVPGRALGASDPAAWPATQDFLKSIAVIDRTIDPAAYYTNKFAEQAAP
jgi:NitT/TauT family transport system substrate-binding protein